MSLGRQANQETMISMASPPFPIVALRFSPFVCGTECFLLSRCLAAWCYSLCCVALCEGICFGERGSLCKSLAFSGYVSLSSVLFIKLGGMGIEKFHTHAHTCMHAHARAHTHTHAHAHTHTHTHTHTQANTHIRTYPKTPTRAHTYNRTR